MFDEIYAGHFRCVGPAKGLIKPVLFLMADPAVPLAVLNNPIRRIYALDPTDPSFPSATKQYRIPNKGFRSHGAYDSPSTVVILTPTQPVFELAVSRLIING